MFPGDSDEIALQFHRRQRAAGIEVSQTSEDQVSEDEGVEWGSREWERLRLEEKVCCVHIFSAALDTWLIRNLLQNRLAG